MASLAGDASVPINTTVADIKGGMCIALSFRLPNTDTTDTCITVVMACDGRNFDITETAPTPIRWFPYETDPRMLETADIDAMNPNISQLNPTGQCINEQDARTGILRRASTDKVEFPQMDTPHILHDATGTLPCVNRCPTESVGTDGYWSVHSTHTLVNKTEISGKGLIGMKSDRITRQQLRSIYPLNALPWVGLGRAVV